MSIRTTRSIVTFTTPFRLSNVDDVLPAGEYAVDQDEQLIEGLSWLAYKRVATLLNGPALGAESGVGQLITVDPLELQAALERDREHAFTHQPKAALPSHDAPPETDGARNLRNDTSGTRRRAKHTAESNRLL
jgi:hypothetical protein